MSERPEDPLLDPLFPALKAGAATGFGGAIVGGAAGIIRNSTTPGLFAAASGIQCFLLGSTYWYSRALVPSVWRSLRDTELDRPATSAIAAGVSGATVGAITRGRANVLPALLIMSGCGFVGQHVYDILDGRRTAQIADAEAPKQESIIKRMLRSKWSPMTVLSDEDYEKMLRDKVLLLDAEIALTNERIDSLKQERAARGRTDQADGTMPGKKE